MSSFLDDDGGSIILEEELGDESADTVLVVDGTSFFDAAEKQQQQRIHQHQQFQAAQAAVAGPATGNRDVLSASSSSSSAPSVVQPSSDGQSLRPMPLIGSGSMTNLPASASAASIAAHSDSVSPVASDLDSSSAGAGPPIASSSLLMPDPSLFSLLGVLNSYRARLSCRTLDHLFDKINVDARTWNLLLRSQLPMNEAQVGMEQLRDTLTEFVKRLNRKSNVCLPTILDNTLYSEEVNFAYRVYSRSNSLQASVFRSLKPLFAELEEYLRERGQMPLLDFKALYEQGPEQRAKIDALFRAIDEAHLHDDGYFADGGGGGGGDDAAEGAGGRSATSSRQSVRRDSASSSSAAAPDGTSTKRRSGVLASFVGRRSHGSSRRSSRKPSMDATATGSGAVPSSATMQRRRRSSLDTAATTTRTGSAATTPPLPLRTVQQPAGGTISAELIAGAAQSTIVDSVPKTVVSSDAEAIMGRTAVLVTDAVIVASAAAAVEDTLVIANENDDDDEDSEEEPEALLAAGEDIFSKLMTASQAHCYPLPQPKKTPAAASASSTLPTDDFLRSYVLAHCKSFRLTEALLDCYFSALQAQLVALAISESLQKADLYAALQADANQLASHLVRFGLPLLGRLLAVDPSFLQANLLALSFGGVERGRVYSDARQVVRKARLLHCLFAALDIFVFPRSVPAHTAGCKGISHAYTDPQFVCTAGYDRAVRIWDLRVGSTGSGGSGGGIEGTGGAKCLAQFMGHTSVVTWCAFAAGDAWLVSGSLDGTVRVWESRTGVCTRVLTGHADGVLCGELGAKDKYVATGSLDCTVRLWSPHTGKCLRVYRGHRHWVKCVRFAPEAQALISTGLDNAIFVWHMRGGVGGGGTTGAGGAAAASADNSGALGAPRHVLLAHSAPVMDVRLLSGGSGCGGGAHFVSASKDLTLRVWDLRQGKEVGQLANPARSTPVALALSPDGKALACAFFDHTINVYEMDAASAAVSSLPSGTADRNGSSGGSNASGGNAAPSSAHARSVSSVEASSSSSVDNSISSSIGGGGVASAGLSPIDGFKLRRQIKVHNDGLICVSWCSRTTLLVGTATGQLQILQI